MNFSKIILTTNAPPKQGLAYYYYRAFVDLLGPERVVILDEPKRRYEAPWLERGVRRLKNELGILSKNNYQQVIQNCSGEGKKIVLLFNSSDLNLNEIGKLAEDGALFLIQYLTDHPLAMLRGEKENILNSLPLFDLVLTFAKPLLPILYQYGAERVERIPFAYCKYTHLIPAEVLSTDYPDRVYYFGKWSPLTEKWLSYLTEFDLEIEGNQWSYAKNKRLRTLGAKSNPKSESQMAITARKAGVVVNFTRAPHGCFHTMKTFELPAAGACVVTNRSEEQMEFFKEDLEIGYFNTPEEMVSQVRYYLENKDKAAPLRENGQKAALKHSYHHRVQQIMTIIDSLKT